jgi:hypothetical protein
MSAEVEYNFHESPFRYAAAGRKLDAWAARTIQVERELMLGQSAMQVFHFQ